MQSSRVGKKLRADVGLFDRRFVYLILGNSALPAYFFRQKILSLPLTRETAKSKMDEC